jgi:hypothetical protein
VNTQYGLGVLQFRNPGAPSLWPFLSLRIEALTPQWIRKLGSPIKQALKKFVAKQAGHAPRCRLEPGWRTMEPRIEPGSRIDFASCLRENDHPDIGSLEIEIKGMQSAWQ